MKILRSKKFIICIVCIVIALTSNLILGKFASSPEFYSKTIQSIDEKKATVMGVTTASALASTALAAVPGDATTPIANQILDISSYLLIVVCALVLEKSLLTVFGYLAFKIMIPIACGLYLVSLFCSQEFLKKLALKITTFAIVISCVIPLSLKISDLIYETNSQMVTELTAEVEEISSEEEEDTKWWDKVKDKIEEGTTGAVEKAKQMVNKFIDVIALFIIVYCAIPIVVFLIVLWFVKFLFNVDISIPSKDKLNVRNYLKKKEE